MSNKLPDKNLCEGGNPGKDWIPGQARNDKSYKTFVFMYINSFAKKGNRISS